MIPESPIANEIAAKTMNNIARAQMVLAGTIMIVLLLCLLVATGDHFYEQRRKREADDAERKVTDDQADADLALTVELSKPERLRDADYWQRWCELNELPNSTRIALMADIQENKAA